MAQQREANRAAEVRWGVNQEAALAREWLQLRGLAEKTYVLPSPAPSSHHDALLLDAKGLPIALVEFKVRRIKWAQYGDTIWPALKHDHALRVKEKLSLPLIGVVRYPDAIVEVNLTGPPDWRRPVTRTDRGYPVDHVGYGRDQHRVWWLEEEPFNG